LSLLPSLTTVSSDVLLRVPGQSPFDRLPRCSRARGRAIPWTTSFHHCQATVNFLGLASGRPRIERTPITGAPKRLRFGPKRSFFHFKPPFPLFTTAEKSCKDLGGRALSPHGSPCDPLSGFKWSLASRIHPRFLRCILFIYATRKAPFSSATSFSFPPPFGFSPMYAGCLDSMFPIGNSPVSRLCHLAGQDLQASKMITSLPARVLEALPLPGPPQRPGAGGFHGLDASFVLSTTAGGILYSRFKLRSHFAKGLQSLRTAALGTV